MNWEVEKEMVVEKRDSQAPPSPGSSPDTEESFTEKMFCGAGVGRGEGGWLLWLVQLWFACGSGVAVDCGGG